jgi:hypothetical protein
LEDFRLELRMRGTPPHQAPLARDELPQTPTNLLRRSTAISASFICRILGEVWHPARTCRILVRIPKPSESITRAEGHRRAPSARAKKAAGASGGL